jgi:predicted ester cyclase
VGVEENKAVLARIVDELLNGQNLDLVDELVHPDYEDGYGGFGRDQYRELLRGTFAAFPDLRLTVEDAVGEGDVVVGRFTLRGTHRGELLGTEPTGRQVEFAAIGWLEFRGGKMIGRWNVSDVHGLLEQLRG